MSPELLKGKYDRSTDLWSVGVMTYIMLSGSPPFNGKDDNEILNSVERGRLNFEGGSWIYKSDDAVDFVRCLLTRDTKRRLTAREALTHPWINWVEITKTSF